MNNYKLVIVYLPDFTMIKVHVFDHVHFINNICIDNHIALIPASYLHFKTQ